MSAALASLLERLAARWWRRTPAPVADPTRPASVTFTPAEYQRAVAALAGRPAGLTDRDLDVLRAAGQGLGEIATRARGEALRKGQGRGTR